MRLMSTPTTIPETLRETLRDIADRLESSATEPALDRAWRLATALDSRASINISKFGVVHAEAFAAWGATHPRRIAAASATSASAAVAQLADELEVCVALRVAELRAQARVEHDVEERRAIEAEARELEARAA